MIIHFKTLDPSESREAMADWIACNGRVEPSLPKDYDDIRREISEIYDGVVANCPASLPRKDYYKDVHFGSKLREYLKGKDWFSMRLACDDGFWRFLSLKVCPTLVLHRWGVDKADHYWQKGSRIWLSSIWWYNYLSWDGNKDSTVEMLDMKRFSTDTIVSLVERTGRNGVYVVLYRTIMKLFSKLPEEYIDNYKNASLKNDSLFRAVMRLNTSRIPLVIPEMYKGGTTGYVKSLFYDLGINYNF